MSTRLLSLSVGLNLHSIPIRDPRECRLSHPYRRLPGVSTLYPTEGSGRPRAPRIVGVANISSRTQPIILDRTSTPKRVTQAPRGLNPSQFREWRDAQRAQGQLFDPDETRPQHPGEMHPLDWERRDDVWWHGTDNNVWDHGTNPEIHMGTMKAAEERLHGRAAGSGAIHPRRITGPMHRNEAKDVGGGDPFWHMYLPEMLGEEDYGAHDPDSKLYSPQGLSRYEEEEILLNEGSHGLYYRNEYEDVGSTSVVVPGSSFDHHRTWEEDVEEAAESGLVGSHRQILAQTQAMLADRRMERSGLSYEADMDRDREADGDYQLAMFPGEVRVGPMTVGDREPPATTLAHFTRDEVDAGFVRDLREELRKGQERGSEYSGRYIYGADLDRGARTEATPSPRDRYWGKNPHRELL